MPMSVNHTRSLFFAGLPLILGCCALGVAIWLGIQPQSLPTGSALMLHQALSNLPAESETSRENLLASIKGFTGMDPFFRPPPKEPMVVASEPVALEELHLTTIAQGIDGKYCLISGRIYHEGQAGNGFLIKKIQPEKVYFETNLATFTLQPGQKVALESGKPIPIENKMQEEVQE